MRLFSKYASIAAAALLAVVGCSESETSVDEPVNPQGEGVPFVIKASTGSTETKTTNDTYNTLWAADDAMTVFHAAAGTTEYGTNDQFTVAEAGTDGTFNGTLTEALTEGTSYDWYLLYPYTSQIATPANTSKGYTYIGCRSDKSQSQTGVNSMAHLAGSSFPLYAVKKGVSSTTIPDVQMQQIASVVRIRVKNGLSEDLTVSNISFTGTEDIVGRYFINFAGDKPVFTPYRTDYVSSTASLIVTDGTIAAGETADFYIGIKPFTAASGSTLTVAVTGTNGAQTKAIALTKETAFTSGKIKTLNFTYDLATKTYEFTNVKELAALMTSASASHLGTLTDAVVTYVSGSTAFLEDATGGIMLYNITDRSRFDVINGEVTTEGKLYNNIPELTKLVVSNASITTTTEDKLPLTEVTIDELNSSSSAYLSQRVKISGATVTTAFNKTGNSNVTGQITKDEKNLAIRTLATGSITKGTKGNLIDVIGVKTWYNSKETNQLYVILDDDITVYAVPTITLDETYSLEYNATSGSLTVTATDATSVSVAVYDDAEHTTTSTWLSATYADGTITLTPQENSTSSARTAYVVVTATNDNGSSTATCAVTQGVEGTAMTIAEMLTAATDTKAVSNEVLVTALTTKGYIATEGTSSIYVYANSTPTVNIGDKVTFTGTRASYNGVPEISSPTTTVISSGNTFSYPDANDITSTFDSYSSAVAEYITFTGDLTKNGNYYNIAVDGATIVGSASYPVDDLGLSNLSGHNVTVTGYYNGISKSSTYKYIIVTSVTDNGLAGVITMSDKSVQVGSTVELGATVNSGATISYSSSNPSVATVNSNGVVTGVAVGTTTITATAPASGEYTAATATCTVTVTTTGTLASYTLEFSSLSKKVSNYTTTWTQTCSGFDWSLANFNNNNGGWTYVRCGRKNNASVATITTSSSISEAIGTVVVTVDKATVSKVNSFKLEVASDSNFTSDLQTITQTIAAGDITFTVSSPATNRYYRITVDCASGSSNGLVQISKVVYTEAAK